MQTLEVKNISKTFTLSRKQKKLEETKQETMIKINNLQETLSKAELKNLKTKMNKKVAVNDLSFIAYPGEIYGLLGPNGAGKTTTLRAISTLIKVDSGDIIVGGTSTIEDSNSIRKKIAFLTSELKLEDHFTPDYLFGYFSKLHGIEEETILKRKESLFKRFGIEKFAEVKVGDLSTGMKQKTSIAISLVHDPDFIIFDEPTNGLDILTARSVMEYLIELKERGKTVIVSTHILSVVDKICDRVGIIIDGKMKLNDTLEKVKQYKDSKNLEDVFFNLVQESNDEAGETLWKI